jgi:hypothetical protein
MQAYAGQRSQTTWCAPVAGSPQESAAPTSALESPRAMCDVGLA